MSEPKNTLRVLAIETSCDETGVAVLRGERGEASLAFTVESAVLDSQAALHAEYGGVYPDIAKREHQANLPHLYTQALKEAGITTADIDAIAVTRGPGLAPALWSGITFAEALATEHNKPLLGVNHLEGHILSSLSVQNMLDTSAEQFPLLALVISGGHTEFVRSDTWFHYEQLGATLDDAVGEAFDKVARMLDLPYPGGPHISRLALAARKAGTPSPAALPRPMLHAQNCDVSFSGLKTAALYALRDLGGLAALSPESRAAFAREFEDAVGDIFVHKTRRALSESNARSFVIGGGVAANRYLRERLTALIAEEFSDVTLHLPTLDITGDNAVMIAEAALARLLLGSWPLTTQAPFKAEANLPLQAR